MEIHFKWDYLKWSMVFHCVYSVRSEKRWVYGTVYTNDRKKCVYCMNFIPVKKSISMCDMLFFKVYFLLNCNVAKCQH